MIVVDLLLNIQIRIGVRGKALDVAYLTGKGVRIRIITRPELSAVFGDSILDVFIQLLFCHLALGKGGIEQLVPVSGTPVAPIDLGTALFRIEITVGLLEEV